MSSSSSQPVAFMEMLADRNRRPAALRVDVTATIWLAALQEQPDFQHLCRHFPLVIAGPVESPELAQRLVTLGCRFLAPESVLRPEGLPDKVLPYAIQWLAGNWYLSPPAKPSPAQAASRAQALQLVQLVMADADTHEIEAVLRRDPALSYHLLRLVNSLGMGMGKRITSFAQALLILGRTQLRRWLNLMVFSSRQGDARSDMLLANVTVRARMMELLAKECGRDKAGQELAFMAGMFSLLGVLFGMPLKDVLQPLSISEELAGALLEYRGELGSLLQLVEAAERHDLAVATGILGALQISPADFNVLMVQSYVWMGDVFSEQREDIYA